MPAAAEEEEEPGSEASLGLKLTCGGPAPTHLLSPVEGRLPALAVPGAGETLQKF